MAEEILYIDDRQLAKYVRELSTAPTKIINRGTKWLRRMTRLTEKKMKQYARSKTKRSTGKLSDSITSTYHLTATNLSSRVFVPASIKYQFVIEEGNKRSDVIKPGRTMTFPVEHWKKARQASGPAKVPLRGYFVFTQVTRGKYKGRFFTKRAFQDLERYYEANKTNILNDIGNVILFSR